MLHHHGEGIEVGAAVGVHDPFGTAGRPGGVVDRDRLLFIQERRARILVAAGPEQVLELIPDVDPPEPGGHPRQLRPELG